MRLLPPYSAFTRVYDATMKNVPYDQWASFIRDYLYSTPLPYESTMLELGCGTGGLTEYIEDIFCNVYALDLSTLMLREAQKRLDLPLVQANIANLPFANESVEACLCAHDTVNYLPEEKDLRQHFKEVHRVLKENGIYIFDTASEYNVQRYYDGRTFREQHGDIYFQWENTYDSREKIIESRMYFSEANKGGIISKEVHRQRIYSEERIHELLTETGFTLDKVTGDYQPERPTQNSQLITFVARKNKLF